jgi:hypothetical protein
MNKVGSHGCNSANTKARINTVHASIAQYPNKFGLYIQWTDYASELLFNGGTWQLTIY